MIELDKYDSQIVLYAKGHFERRSEVNDIRTILGWRNAYPAHEIPDQVVISHLTELLQKCNLWSERNINDMMQQMAFGYRWDSFDAKRLNRKPFDIFFLCAMDLLASMKVINREVLVKFEPIDESCGLKRRIVSLENTAAQ